MGTSSIPSGGGGGLQPRYQKFTSSGTFTLPDGYGAAKPLLVNIQVIGGGGGGTGARLDTNASFNKNTSYTGSFNSYFGNSTNLTVNTVTGPSTAPGSLTGLNNINIGGAGGSGGIAQTQFYLTSNLTITVGAGGARAAGATINTVDSFARNDFANMGDTWGSGVGAQPSFTNNSGKNDWGNNDQYNDIRLTKSVTAPSGGTGGTTTAGAVSATGGVGGSAGALVIRTTTTQALNFYRYGNQNVAWNFGNTWDVVNQTGSSTQGSGGQPAGTTGAAIPLLGTLAGGSNTTTPVYGSYGIGGIKTDATTHTGVEGTGGGFDSAGGPGAVILTWWQ
jgi:hypothetical protein